MKKQKNFLLFAILVGAAGIVIGGITLYLSISNITMP